MQCDNEGGLTGTRLRVGLLGIETMPPTIPAGRREE